MSMSEHVKGEKGFVALAAGMRTEFDVGVNIRENIENALQVGLTAVFFEPGSKTTDLGRCLLGPRAGLFLDFGRMVLNAFGYFALAILGDATKATNIVPKLRVVKTNLRLESLRVCRRPFSK